MIVRSSSSKAELDQPHGSNPGLLPWRWSADQFSHMLLAGVIDEADRIELIDGEVVCISPAEVSHNRTVANLNRCFASVMDSHELLIQSTVRVSDTTVVDPDVTILRRPNSQDEGELPYPGDVLLLIEVADSSLKKDLTTKCELYARAGIPEYWVANIRNKTLIVHRQPDGDRYESTLTLHSHEKASPELISELSLAPAAIFD